MGLTMTHMGPWASVSSDEAAAHPGHQLYVRFDVLPSGRLRIVEVRAVAAGGVDAAFLRSVPLRRVEAIVNSPEVAPQVREFIAQATDTELRLGVGDLAVLPTVVYPDRPRSLRVEVPEGHRRPDDFYRQVAAVHAVASETHRSPARAVADANGVPVSTVHRWLREAKRRGLLAPTRRSDLPELDTVMVTHPDVDHDPAPPPRKRRTSKARPTEPNPAKRRSR